MHPKLKLLAIFAIFTSCAPIGHQYCISNNYEKGSAQYEQCTLHYQANQELYQYCMLKKGLSQEGQQMNQCLETARSIKDSYTKDNANCHKDAEVKFSGLLSQAKKEKQPTLNQNGFVTLSEIEVGGYTPYETQSYTGPFIQQCLRIYGWNNADDWKDDKTSVGISSITSGLSELNRKSIMVSIPENPVTKLFKAVSDGNAYAVRDILVSGMPVNSQNYQGYTALHVAAKQGNFQIVQMLIEELHADTEIRSNQGEKAIDMAARSSNPSLVGYITDTLRKRDIDRIKHEELEDFHRQEHERHSARHEHDNKELGNSPKCYWMENSSGKFTWVPASNMYNREIPKNECRNLDSCNGGNKASGGGCYKWAVSSEANGLPW